MARHSKVSGRVLVLTHMVVKVFSERKEVAVMMTEGQVNELLQRWRDTPEEELTQEDRQNFKDLACACLAQEDSYSLLTFLQDDKNQMVVKSMGCVLLAPLVKELLNTRKTSEHVQAAILHITTTCRPDEVLQNLLNIVEDSDPETIVVVVPHLQTGLLRLKENQASSLGSALTVLHKQLSRLPVPYTEKQEEDDLMGLGRSCHALSVLTKTFTEAVRNNGGQECREMKTELLNFCMKSLREPLLEALLTPGRRTSHMWLFAVHIMDTLAAIQESVAEILFFSTMGKNIQMEKKQLDESKGCLAYLVFVKLLDAERFPVVFSPEFVLWNNVKYVHQLLSSKKESHVLKGLVRLKKKTCKGNVGFNCMAFPPSQALFEKSLQKVQDNSLPATLLAVKSFYDVKQSLLQVLTDCPMKHLRESGLKVLQLLINKQDTEAKHKLFRCLLKTSNHPGVEGYIVKNIRNQVEFSMAPGNATSWFLGSEFVPLLGLVLSLPQGAETDILHNMDKIMESLNLLRYLLIRNNRLRNDSDVWESVSRMKDEYTRTLHVCISMSRAYYTSQLSELRDEHKLKARAARASKCTNTCFQSETVKQKKLSKMSPDVQHQVVQCALVTFDLMESLIVRVEEISEEKNSHRVDTSALYP
ncbi:glomulin-like isoform X2 [Corythoichthys intestinalis]|uniref:glomulin-like isoform X2 n=1 Tax=Corythoichthys intestinalis TaxID=161448 RepID=UPI0025A5C0C6|nr:glomulin-like isoform X2 [Corythoichthys intestinalis]